MNGCFPISKPALTNAAVAISTAKGMLTNIIASNPNAADAYIQVFDTNNAAGVVVGTTPATYVIPLRGSQGLGTELDPIMHVNGMAVAATTTPTGAVAPATAVSLLVGYRNAGAGG